LGCAFLAAATASAQEPAEVPPAKKETPKAEEKAALPFQITLLETHVRFEANGDSRKDVHTIVQINDLAGARQFSRVGFEYNRAFQSVEIPLVKISHANGGTSEILPSAITDVVNPAVEKFPAYQDLRVKAVRILGLQEGDKLEYRVITTTTKPPLAPDFWLEHTFDRSGQVIEEHYELDLPGHLTSTTNMLRDWNGTKPGVYLGVPSTSFRNAGEAKMERSIYEWEIASENSLPDSRSADGVALPDIIVSSFSDWMKFSSRMASQTPAWGEADRQAVEAKLKNSSQTGFAGSKSLSALYQLVAQTVATVDLPLGAEGYRVRGAKEVLETGYGSPLEKCFLLAQLAQWAGRQAEVLFYGGDGAKEQFPRPSLFDHIFVGGKDGEKYVALDPSVEVAPFGVIAAQFRGKLALSLSPHDAGDYLDPWTTLPEKLPFRAFQKVATSAKLGEDGKLDAHVNYTLRGDNELLLRVAFHQTPKERWNEVAGMLALADGFRGHIESVKASDPMETKEPFTVEYEIAQPKFVDWAKKPVRIPALLPQIALPDTAGKTAGIIELGTPLDVETHLTLQLPQGTTVQTPPGTSVERDYATYASKYNGQLNMLTASRHVHFLLREIAAERAADYNAFVRAVQLDQAQVITLFPPAQDAQKEKSSPQR
jgi:hypothetical protein